MNTKDYLKQGKYLDQIIRCNQEELMRLQCLFTGISAVDYSKISVRESNCEKGAEFTRTLEQIQELEEQIREDTVELVSLKKEIRHSIEQVEDKEERAVLQYRYLLGNTLEEIADKLNMSMSTVKRVHMESLKKLF